MRLHLSKQQKQNHSVNSRMERKKPPNQSGSTDRRADTTKDEAFVEIKITNFGVMTPDSKTVFITTYPSITYKFGVMESRLE